MTVNDHVLLYNIALNIIIIADISPCGSISAVLNALPASFSLIFTMTQFDIYHL